MFMLVRGVNDSMSTCKTGGYFKRKKRIGCPELLHSYIEYTYYNMLPIYFYLLGSGGFYTIT